MDFFSLESVVRVHPDVVWRDIDGEVVVLNVSTGQYFGLDEIGSTVWLMIESTGAGAAATGTSLTALRDRVVAEFDVDPETAARDLVELMTHLASQQLIVAGA